MCEHVGYLPLKQAANWAGVSKRTLQRWIAGGLPTYQASPKAKVLIRPADIDQFLTRHKRSPLDLNTLVDQVIADLQQQHSELHA